MENPTTHVAIFPGPGISHITPTLELAKRLVELHGLHVSLYVITTGASAAQAQLIRSPAFPKSLRLIELPPVLQLESLILPDAQPVTRISVLVRESLPALRTFLSQEAVRPTVLVTGIFTTAAFGIADELRMSKYVYFPSGAMPLALMIYLPTLDREVQGEYTEPVRIPGCKPIPVSDLVSPMMDRKSDEYVWYVRCSSQHQMAYGILLNAFEEIDATALTALRDNPALVNGRPTPRVYPVGPLIKSVEPPGPNREECLAWLDLHPPDSVLFVSFGSAGTLSSEQTTELAWGLEMSQQRFLWVVRRPSRSASAAFLSPGANVADDPSEYLPEGFLERTRGTGMVVLSWAPQISILRHDSVGSFLMHGGWNSTMESIVHGVPMIVWPLFAEQKMNASLLSDDLKVAIQVRPKEGLVMREEVEKVVRLIVEGEEGKALRERVKQLSDAALRALEEGGSSYNSLAEVVTEWKLNLRCEKGVEEKNGN